jgi:hypothetical protein
LHLIWLLVHRGKFLRNKKAFLAEKGFLVIRNTNLTLAVGLAAAWSAESEWTEGAFGSTSKSVSKIA